MKKFIFGLILALFTLSALPVQAHTPDDGVKTEIVKADAFNFVATLEVSVEVPQILFDEYSFYRPVELWNYFFQNLPADLNNSDHSKNKFNSWRFVYHNNVNSQTNFIKNKNLHIDPGNFLF